MTMLEIMDAESRVEQIGSQAVAVTLAVRAEQTARDDRDEFLEAMVNALLGQPNPMTEKPHSATSAEKATKESEQYKEKSKSVLDAECARILAWAQYERTKLSARLAVVAVGGSV